MSEKSPASQDNCSNSTKRSDLIKPENKADDHTKRYGCWKWRPSCLQFFNRPAWFLVWFSIAAFAQSFVVNGLVGVSMSSLEKQFNLKSSDVGWISSAYELSGVPVLLIVGFIGNWVNRPRWLSASMTILSLGCFLFALPHFTSSLYQYTDTDVGKHCVNQTEHCASQEGVHDLSGYLTVFIIASVMLSLGANPLYLLGVPYLDDGVTHGQSSLYLGIFYSMTSLGPACAYIGGGALLLIYTDFDRVDMSTIDITPNDSQWVGAWWIGFLLAFVLCALVVLPFAGFPFSLPLSDDAIEEKAKERNKNSDEPDELQIQRDFGESMRDILPSLKRIGKNLTWIFMTFAGIGDGMLIVGFSAFGPKYVENQFSMSAAMAGALFGIVTVPGAAGGTILGGWSIKFFKITSLKLMLRVTCILHICCFLCAVMFFIQCDNPPFAGVNIAAEMNGTVDAGLGALCNSECGCVDNVYDPQCGADNIIYFSPCYAGCQSVQDGHYSNCSCVLSDDATTHSGFCATPGCTLAPLFIIFFFIAMFLIFVSGMYGLQIGLRVVSPEDRPASLGIGWLIGRLLGTSWGALIFGTALDGSCVLWAQNCDGTTGSCYYYDNHGMAWNMMLVCVCCKLFTIFLTFLAYLSYKEPKIAPAEIVMTLSSEETGLGYANNSNDVVSTEVKVSPENNTASGHDHTVAPDTHSNSAMYNNQADVGKIQTTDVEFNLPQVETISRL